MSDVENWKIRKRLWSTKGLKVTERCVAEALLQFRNNKTGLCCPSHEKIAEMVEMSRDAVRKAIRGLRAKKIVHARFRGKRTNEYIFFPCSVKSECSGVTHSTPRCDAQHPLKERTGYSQHENGSSCTHRKDQNDPIELPGVAGAPSQQTRTSHLIGRWEEGRLLREAKASDWTNDDVNWYS